MTLPSDYPALLRALDDWQASAHLRYPGIIPCASGCAACCHGPFDISVADALLVRDTVAALPALLRGGLVRRAGEQLERMQRLEPGLIAPHDVSLLEEAQFDALSDALADEPCPALDSELRCLIYDGRPVVCRMMGLGLETPSGDLIENACPIQEEFPAYRALPPQRFDLATWEDGEAAARADAARILFGSESSAGYETTVAGAILLTLT